MADISLCIPVFNSAAFLDELFDCLRSLVILPAEIVFLDDASNDDSALRLKMFADSPGLSTAVRVLTNERNGGIAAAYNRLAREARSEWIQLLDADDKFANRDYFARVQAGLGPECDLVITGLVSNAVFLSWCSRMLGRLVPKSPPRWWPLLGSFATRSGVLYRRERLIEHPFPDPAWPGSDVIHLLGLRKPGVCAYLYQPQVFYRVHSKAQSSRPQNYALYRQQLARFGPAVRLAYGFDLALRRVGQKWLR